MDNFEKFYNKALRFLSYRPRSEKEVRDYLKRHSGEERKRRLQNILATKQNGEDSGHSQNDVIASIIEHVIAKLKEQKFLNDEEFVKWWVEQRTAFKPRSLRLIKLELKQKGILQETIDEILRYKDTKILSDKDSAKKLVEKRIARFRNKFGMTREEIYRKLGSYLSRRGFDWETIKQSIDEVILKRV